MKRKRFCLCVNFLFLSISGSKSPGSSIGPCNGDSENELGVFHSFIYSSVNNSLVYSLEGAFSHEFQFIVVWMGSPAGQKANERGAY
jgi:hypothetical protein